MEERRVCSAFRTSLFSEVTPTPIFWEPVSIPICPSCVAHPVLYQRWMVNGCLQHTEALCSFNKIRAFLVVVGINGFPFSPITSTLITCSFLTYTGNKTVPAACPRKFSSPMSDKLQTSGQWKEPTFYLLPGYLPLLELIRRYHDSSNVVSPDIRKNGSHGQCWLRLVNWLFQAPASWFRQKSKRWVVDQFIRFFLIIPLVKLVVFYHSFHSSTFH